MPVQINQEVVNDAAKLMLHRLIARAVTRDPSLVEAAKAAHARIAGRYPKHDFVREWSELLRLQPHELRRHLTSRDPDMYRLRLSSPFFLTADMDFTDENIRRRIRRAATRVVQRGARRPVA